MVRQTPDSTATIVSGCPFCFRHISPRPERKNHISSTVRCVTAFDVCPGGSSKWAMLPLPRARSTRTSDPSGQIGGRRVRPTPHLEPGAPLSVPFRVLEPDRLVLSELIEHQAGVCIAPAC